MPPAPWISNEFWFLQPIAKRVASKVPALPFANCTSAITASSTLRFGAIVRASATPEAMGPFR